MAAAGESVRMVEDGARRALIFRMAGEESYTNGVQLARTVERAGFQPMLVPFWPDLQQPADSPGARALLDGGFDRAPRMSAFAFARRFGFAPDLIDLSAHNLAIGDARIDNLITESAWNQQMRGTAARAAALMAELAPDVVFVPHGGEVVSRLLAVMAAHLQLPYVYWESPFFPGYHFVDAFAPHFFRGACRIDLSWRELGAPADAAALARADDFVRAWRAQRLSKYAQTTDPRALAALSTWLGQESGPVVFVPGQVPFDATIAVSLREYDDLGAIYRAVLAGLPAPWRVIFKPHPRNPDPIPEVSGSERVFLAAGLSIHDIFPHCQAVALHSSNVGLEALMVGLPVIAWGEPYYGRKGLTIDLDDAADVARVLAAGVPPAPDPLRVRGLVAHVLERGLVRQDDGAEMASRIAEASAAPPPARASWYGAPLQRLLAVGYRLDAALARNLGMQRALAQLSRDERRLLESRFGARAMWHLRGWAVAQHGLVRRLLLARLFRRRLGLRVVVSPVNLQAMADPRVALRRLAAMARRRPVVAVLPAAGTDRHAVQRLTVAEVREMAAAWRLRVEAFPGAGAASAPAPATVLLLRPQGAQPVSAEDEVWLTGQLHRANAPWHRGRAGAAPQDPER